MKRNRPWPLFHTLSRFCDSYVNVLWNPHFLTTDGFSQHFFFFLLNSERPSEFVLTPPPLFIYLATVTNRNSMIKQIMQRALFWGCHFSGCVTCILCKADCTSLVIIQSEVSYLWKSQLQRSSKRASRTHSQAGFPHHFLFLSLNHITAIIWPPASSKHI